MFEILLENILQKYLGGYFKNVDTAKLSAGVFIFSIFLALNILSKNSLSF